MTGTGQGLGGAWLPCPLMPGLVAAIFSALLIATGITKVIRPADTTRAVRVMGLPWAPLGTRALGMVEVVVGALVLMTASPSALFAQTGLYLVFLGFVVIALRRDLPIASCGCLGRDDTPPYWGHVVLNLVGAGASVGAALGGTITWGDGALATVADVAIVATGAFLAWNVLGISAVASARRVM